MPNSTPGELTVDGTTLELVLERKRVKNVNAHLRGSTLLVSAPVGMAEEAFERTLRSAIDDGDKGDQARAKMHLGIVHRYRGEPGATEDAETEFREALPLAASSEDGDKLGDVLLNLAWLLYEDRRDFDEARRFAEDAARAYANAQSDKESQARDLIDEIDSTDAA